MGKIEKMGVGTPGDSNMEDATNLWVTIQPHTGLVTATEVGPDDAGGADPGTDISLAESRYFATSALTLGGR